MTTLNFNPFPGLETERLILRQVGEYDADEIFLLRSDKRVNEYLDREPATSINDAIAHIKSLQEFETNNEAITWAISLKGDSKLIGTICYWKIEQEHSKAEIGYSLLPDYQRKGIMQEAFVAVLKYGLEVMKLRIIEADVHPENTASIRLLKRNMFINDSSSDEKYCYKTS